jgi:hypothetical protein
MDSVAVDDWSDRLLALVRQDFGAHLNATTTHRARVWVAGTNCSSAFKGLVRAKLLVRGTR